jgi:glyoxylase-like metal-dependent hydrolase (beta-lactamase superfamily II)
MITQISPEITEINFQNFGSIIYLIQLPNQNILIDTSSKENSEELIQSLSQLNISTENINTIILTHAHYDHTENMNLFPNAKIYGNFTKQINPDHTQTEIKNILPIENQPIKEFKIYKTPGHTQGDILIQYKNILFTGDVIFHDGYIGRTDFPESNQEKMDKSLEFIKTLKFDILCAGH